MSALQQFQFESQEVRSMLLGDAPWFVASDICRVLEHGNPRQAVSRLDEDERGVTIVDTLGGPQEMAMINESGLWSLVLTSRKPAAKRFKKWITSEVLPSIRKTGRYEERPSAPQMSGMVPVELGEYIGLLKFKAETHAREVERLTTKREVRPFRPGTDAEKTEARRLRAEGYSLAKIADHLDRSESAISYLVRGDMKDA